MKAILEPFAGLAICLVAVLVPLGALLGAAELLAWLVPDAWALAFWDAVGWILAVVVGLVLFAFLALAAAG